MAKLISKVLVIASVLVGLPTQAFANEPSVVRLPVLTAVVQSKVVQVKQTFTISGQIKPAVAGVVVKRVRQVEGSWTAVPGGTATTNKAGKWKMEITAPSRIDTLKYKIYTPNTKTKAAVYRTIKVINPVPPTVTLNTTSNYFPANTFTTLAGTYNDFGKPVSIEIQQLVGGAWFPANAITTVGKDGWVARVQLPVVPGPVQLRALATTDYGQGEAVLSLNVSAVVENAVDRFGPGSPSRILGMDVARYQRLNSDGTAVPIDYNMAYSNGMRYVIIKASDDLLAADAIAASLAPEDRSSAQTAGLYTGFYHFMGMTRRTATVAIIEDARYEAIHAVKRLVSVGGYNSLDLPYTLDVEYSSAANSGIADGANNAQITLWVKTFLQEMYDRTGRWPIVYGSPATMKKLGTSDAFWENIPFWVARYPSSTDYQFSVDSLNLGRTVDQPSLYITPWYRAGATQWAFWQYSSSGPAKQYGIANGQTRLDMNVFNGGTTEFMRLVNQPWQPLPGDYEATYSDVTMQVQNVSSPADAVTTFEVRVSRTSNGAPAVSGELALTQLGMPIAESEVRPVGVGVWRVTLPAQFLGFQWIDLNLNFTDANQFYAPKLLLQTITVL